MSFWRRHRWTPDEITVARELTVPGWHDAIQLGGHAMPARKVKRIVEHYVELGYAERRAHRLPGTRQQYRMKNLRELTKIGEHQL